MTRFHFEGRLTARANKRHILHRFLAPAGVGQIDIHFRYAPAAGRDLTNLITLAVFDPAGFRGAGHRSGAEHHVRITPDSATPGYLPGPLPAGEWTVQLDMHRIMPAEPVCYWLDVALTPRSHGDLTPLPPLSRGERGEEQLPSLPEQGAGWYRGDLHAHTDHSDAEGCSVADLIEAARRAHLDFIFLTDHNTTAGHAEAAAASSEELLVAAGVELTTFWGHALCLGTRDWVDWRIRPGDGEIGRIAAATYAAGQLFIIAHPQSNGDPGCTGCAWRFGELMPGNARLVEIWNGPWAGDSNNEAALALWYDWLNQGRRLVATAGSDTHSRRAYARGPGFNVVYAKALTEAALLKALLAGHLYLSAGPTITFAARGAGDEMWISGDTATGPATFTLTWTDCPADANVRVIANGKLLEQWPAADEPSRTWRMTPDEANWVLAEIRGGDGQMLAVTNPIFFQ